VTQFDLAELNRAPPHSQKETAMFYRCNEDRADAGAAALFDYAARKGETTDEGETIATDLLSDLMHLCSRSAWDFDQLLTTARAHHAAELEEEGEPEPCPIHRMPLDRCGCTDAQLQPQPGSYMVRMTNGGAK
jgi:hypothetical protein